MANNKNWMVIVSFKDRLELKGIYSTKRAAEFISSQVKKAERLSTYPKVIPTQADLYPGSNKVEEHLKNLDARNSVSSRRKKVIKYMPTVNKS